MRINEIKALVSAPPRSFVYAKVETSNGLVGYGEAETDGVPEVQAASIEALGKTVIGLDPNDIEFAYQTIMTANFGLPPEQTMRVAGAIDEALLDIKGKALKTPVYNLLGGRFREKIRLYCHLLVGAGGLRKDEKERKTTPEMVAEAAREQVRHGFTVLKFDPFTTVYWEEVDDSQISAYGGVKSRLQQGMSYPRKLVPRAVGLVKAVREAVGPEIGICTDIHGRFDVESAIRIGRLLEPYDLFFYEEPIPPGNEEALTYVRQRVNIPICCGERRYTLEDFRHLFELQATDIVMPDHARNGGISMVRKIADLANIYHVPLAPHVVYSSPLNAVITAHTCASVPNFLISESMGPQRLELYKDLLRPQILPEQGYLKVPDKPGLGVELNEENLNKQYPPP
jgi:galactonate dehydratase